MPESSVISAPSVGTPPRFEEKVATYRARVNAALEAFLSPREPKALFVMLRYFLGFTDEAGVPLAQPVGKRFRPVLTLLFGEFTGNVERAMSAALSVELFHNFTLIHDDIVDKDELRRGRKTVWKIWGEHHAINSGDAQLLLSFEPLAELRAQDSEIGRRTEKVLRENYLKIIEGQYHDFLLADSPLTSADVTEEAYFTMIEEKTAVLVAAAALAGAIAGGVPENDEARFYRYGHALGLLHQLFDDYASLWGTTAETGKREHGDVFEKKKTLPVLFAHRTLAGSDRAKLEELYGKSGTLTDAEVASVMTLLEQAGAQAHMRARIEAQTKELDEALSALPFSDAQKAYLGDMHRALFPAR